MASRRPRAKAERRRSRPPGPPAAVRASSRTRPLGASASALEERVAAMLARIRASGFKLTPQRVAIVRELAADPTHPTAQELYDRLRASLPTMSFATVYNTLGALAAAGLCEALSLAPGATRFDPNMAAHHHAVCDVCGLVRDVPVSGESSHEGPAPAELAAAPGFAVRAVERIYRGLCASCAKRASRSGKQRAGEPRGSLEPSTPG